VTASPTAATPAAKRSAPAAVVFGPSGSGKVTPASRTPASMILPASPKTDPLEV
jgi:hypothetical protein